MAAYYSENDPKAAAWLRELIRQKLIADGEVDTRSIVEVEPWELTGFTQCHFFAGIGGWSYALKLAGWPDDRECWTGSCPCQPWSAAGNGLEANDPRDLWPAWFKLIRKRLPFRVFGEQVAGAPGRAWIDRVHADLEALEYAVAPIDLTACSIGAPHRRQRMWFVADAAGQRWERQRLLLQQRRSQQDRAEVTRRGAVGGMADYASDGRRQGRENAGRISKGTRAAEERSGLEQRRQFSELADANGRQSSDGDVQRSGRHDEQPKDAPISFWADVEWLACTDGKFRPVEPGTFPLAHGLPARVGRLRGYGNAIVPQVAAEVIGAYMDICDDDRISYHEGLS